MKNILLAIITLAITTNLFSQTNEDLTKKLEGLFNDYKGCFVLYDQNQDTYFRYNEITCNKRYGPMSTFKVPNSLIALESGILKDENTVTKWDSIRNPANDWWAGLKWDQDQNLQTAFERSVVWYYQEIAKQIERKEYESYLKNINYGNTKIGDQVDFFWLDGSLQISANEQIEFLKSFYNNKFEFSENTSNIVKKIFLRTETNNYRLSYKAGGGDIDYNTFIGWLIGYVEKEDNVYYFAMNIITDDIQLAFQKRMDISLDILKHLNLID